MTDLERRLAALSPAKRALAAQRLGARPRASTGPRARARGPGVNTLRTSYAQERLWFLEQVAPGSLVQNVAGAVRAAGRLDVMALQRALALVVARHETLRTTFVAIEGTPHQVVSPRGVVSFGVRDVGRAGTEAACLAEALGLIAREVRAPFDVAHGPLVRVLVCEIRDDLRVVGVVMHHLIADAWSVDVFVRELAATYAACARGAIPAPSSLGLQYADHAEWQRERFDGAGGEALASYWRQQLQGAPYPEVGSGHQRAFRGAARSRELSVRASEDIRALARREGVTVYVAMLTVWQAVLARWIGRDDVTVLSPIANREHSEVAETLGFFVNLVALRTRVGGNPSFRALLASVKETVRGALLHQELPFEKVLSILGVDRTLARPPLSPFGFALEQAEIASIRLPDVELSPLELETTTSGTDLALIVGERTHHLTLRLEHDSGVHTALEVDGLLRDLVQCLDDVVGAPERPLSELAIRARNAPTTVASSEADGLTNIWERFAAHVANTPDVVAVRAAGASVRYAELHRAATARAAELAQCGVERDTIVAVWGERGCEWITAMLAIWNRGGVYLPLDPRWPAARVRQILAQSGAAVVLTGPEPPPVLREGAADAAWRLVPSGSLTASARAREGRAEVAPTDLAYVIFTSGSTGTPKGALIEHAGLSNHLAAKCALLALGAGDRVAQTAAASFDISLWQVLAPLAVGATVDVFDDATVRDPRALIAAVRARGVTVLEVVPAVLELMLEEDSDASALASLRWLVVTGEALPPALARKWLARHPAIPLVNAYGPTECADDVTHHVLRTPPPSDALRVAIGRPIAGATVHVLDAQLRPVPCGAEGEICVGGVGVGRGYLHDPTRTAASFLVPDPFDGRPGSRLYRTGDRGRQNADGTFECLGRLDEQVKIRGARVEPAEVAAVLQGHPSVRQAAVVARESGCGGLQLVAYVASELTTAELRTYVAERVPDPMVPASFVALPALPLTANGKIDRAALPGPDSSVRVAVTAEPRVMSPMERLIAELWAEILGVEVDGPDANFFALGGDSLSSIRLVACARQRDLFLTPKQVFEHQTVAALATVTTRSVGALPEQGLVVGDVPPPPIQRMLLEADVTGHDHYNMAMLLEVDGPLAAEPLAIAVEHLMRHHDALRLRIRRDGGTWRSHVAGLDGDVPFELVDLADVPDAEVGSLLEARSAEVQATLDLAAGPILRIVAFDLGRLRPSRLLVVVHHVACDAASWPVLLEDLATVYGQLQRGSAIRLPAKTTSYQAWARRLADYGRASDRVLDLGFWKRECGEPVFRLPLDDEAASSSAIAAVARLEAVLDAEETVRVLRAASGRGVTVEVVLLTALTTSLAEWSRSDRLLVFLERHGREAPWPGFDLSRTVGWFTAVFPVCLRVASSGNAAETLALVDLHLREVPEGGLAYGILRYAAEDPDGWRAGEVLRALPHPEVSFNYLGRVDPPSGAAWRMASESPGPDVGLRGQRPTVLDVTASLAGGRLCVVWDYDAARHRPATIQAVIARFLEVVRELARGMP